MTKQKEIREGMEQILGILYNFHLDGDAYVDKLLKYLHKNGVVIKGQGELPLQVFCYKCHEVFDFPNEGLGKAGYVATEPLIEEG